MTEEERDNDLEKLFRNKLEEHEMATESGLTGRVMRRLNRKEFLRFNPARFNVYYLASAVAGLTVATLMLLTSPRGKNTLPEEQTPKNWQPAIPDSTVLKTEPRNGSELQKVTVTETASGTGKAEPAPGGVTERQNGISTPAGAGESNIKVARPENANTTVAHTALTIPVINASVTSGCVPLHVIFRNSGASTGTTEWSFGDGGLSHENNPDYIYDLPGTYIVSLTVTDPGGHKTVATETIEAWARPSASFEIRQNDPSGENNKAIFVNLSSGAVQYLWDFGDGTFSTLSDPSYRYEQPGSYNVTLVAFSENGCADSLTINDAFTDNGTFIRFPNAFMPNTGGPTGGYYSQRTDEDNQVFHPVTSGVTSYNLKIYNKVGMLVFESDDIAMGWDGYYKGQICPPGVYVWKVRGTYRNGQPVVMAGDVTLLNY
jgi:PKD repeat protein